MMKTAPAAGLLGVLAALAAFGLAPPAPGAAQTRDRVRIVGSSTVFPYAQAVAEEYVGLTHGKAPVVEATGTGGGLKLFCGGVGTGFPDLTGASRAITPSEYRDCVSNGAGDITEAAFGRDGITVTQSLDGPPMALTRRELFLALAAEVPVHGALVPNPYENWREIDPALPDLPILVLGPPPTSGTRDALVALAMRPGCAGLPEIAALDPERRAVTCARTRQDGRFVEVGENDNLILQRLIADPTAFGIFGYSFVFENRDRVRGVAIDGVPPGIETLATGDYDLTRPLFLYIKNPHRGVIPGMEALLAEFFSEEAIGPDGYLSERGLVPLPAEARDLVRADVAGHVRPRRFE